MSRQFNGSTQYLGTGSSPISGNPFTLGGWFNGDTLTGNDTIISLGDANNEITLYMAGDTVNLFLKGGTPLLNIATTAMASTGTWSHAAGVGVSATDHRVFFDGGNKGSSGTSVSPVPVNARIGRSPSSSNFFDGLLAEMAVWNVALSDAEIALWAKGFSPLFIQPHNLVAYWPLIRDDDNDWIGGFDLTAFNTPTVSPHPPLVVHPAYGG